MATSAPVLPTTITTDATFRTAAQAIDAAITGFGLVQTADTGQVDLTTATKPAGTGSYAGYKVYRFADALQATKPVFIRVDYGTDPFSATRFSVKITVGSGTNGAGTLNGIVGTALIIGPGSVDPALGASHLSGSTNRLVVGLYTGDTNNRGSYVSVERTHADDGTDDGNGVVAVVHGTNVTGGSAVPLSASAGAAAYNNSPSSLTPSGDSTAVVGTSVEVFPLYFPVRFSKNSMRGVLAYMSTDIAPGTEIDVDPDGHGSVHYVALAAMPTTANPPGTTANSRALIRFD